MSVIEVGHEPVRYVFGDSDIAAQRLEVLGRVFARSTRALLESTALPSLGLGVDLGCGPGHSTRFLAEVLPAEHVAGIDNSEHFIALAQSDLFGQSEAAARPEGAGEGSRGCPPPVERSASAPPRRGGGNTPGRLPDRPQSLAKDRVSFYLHDFTRVPFPVGPADLLYARFELSHVQEPGGLIERWATQLRPGGLLLMEETEWIQSSHPAFSAYLEIVEAMLDSQGTKLYVGRELDDLSDLRSLRRRYTELSQFHVRNQDAALMFYLNIQTWKHHPFVQASYPSAMIEQLEADLEAMTRWPGEASDIEWGLRQLVFERI